MNVSPYEGASVDKWNKITHSLLSSHPLSSEEIVDVVLTSWGSLFNTKIGTNEFIIGEDILPKPQIMGFFLHELIPLELASRYPGSWRREEKSDDKDAVYIPNDYYSFEIKTSSNSSHIFGNRSYAQQGDSSKKSKSGYYLTINFEKFKVYSQRPAIAIIRFGWIDSSDWIGQKSETGQQSRLPKEVEQLKLVTLYSLK